MNLPSVHEKISNSFASSWSTRARSRLKGDSAPISIRICPCWRFSFSMRPHRFGQRLGGDETLFEQDLPERLVRDVRAHRDRVAARERDDLLGRVLEQQQRAGRPLRVEPLEQPRERRALERPGERGLGRVGHQVLGAALDVASLALLDRIAQARLRHAIASGAGVSSSSSGAGEPRGAGPRRGHELGQARARAWRGSSGRQQILGGGEPAAGLGAVAGAPVRAGDEHDGHRARLRIVAQLLGEPEPVPVAEAGAEHDDVGRSHRHAAFRPGRVGLGGELEAGLAQRGPDLLLQLDVRSRR